MIGAELLRVAPNAITFGKFRSITEEHITDINSFLINYFGLYRFDEKKLDNISTYSKDYCY